MSRRSDASTTEVFSVGMTPGLFDRQDAAVVNQQIRRFAGAQIAAQYASASHDHGGLVHAASGCAERAMCRPIS